MAELIDRMAVEQAFTTRLGLWTERHKQQLVDLLGDPPDWSKVTDEFWNRVEEEMKTELAIILLLIFSASARQHGSAQASGSDWSVARSTGIASSFIANSKSRLDAIKQGAIEVKSNSQGSSSLLDPKRIADDVFSTSRFRTIVATETTAAQSAGSEAAARNRGDISLQDTWFTERDGRVCSICGPLHASVRGVWDQAFPSGPPAHPNCRCWIKYAGVPAAMETV
jgi:hypothetical protein